MIIKKIDETNDKVGVFINKAFTDYGNECCVELNFEEYCFIAEEDGEIIGAITGRAYYNEVHIDDLIIDGKHRRLKVGSKLVAAVESAFAGRGYSKITLTTFGFQAPEFYKKLGYELEFLRNDNDAKLCKYFYIKSL